MFGEKHYREKLVKVGSFYTHRDKPNKNKGLVAFKVVGTVPVLTKANGQ